MEKCHRCGGKDGDLYFFRGIAYGELRKLFAHAECMAELHESGMAIFEVSLDYKDFQALIQCSRALLGVADNNDTETDAAT